MQIILNKDMSIAAIEPTKVYQGSANASYISIFAPFSVGTYGAVKLYFELPSGEVLESQTAFPIPGNEQPFGAWSAPIDSRVTALPGTVKLALCLVGQTDDGDITELNTSEAIDFEVIRGVIPVLPEQPTNDVYEKILAAYSALLENVTTANNLIENAQSAVDEAQDILNQSQALLQQIEQEISDITGSLDKKLDKIVSGQKERVYAVSSTDEQTMLEVSQASESANTIPKRKTTGAIATADPTDDNDAVTLRYLKNNYTPKTFVQSLYFARTGAKTAQLTIDKPSSNVNNYVSLTINNDTLDFTSQEKISVSYTLVNNISLSKSDGVEITLAFGLNNTAQIEYGARLKIGSRYITSEQAFGLTTYQGSGSYTTVNEEYFVLKLDEINDIETFNAGEVMTIEIIARSSQVQFLVSRIYCGVNISGVDRNSFFGLTFTATTITTEQIENGAITKPKLSADIQNSLDLADSAYQKPASGIPAADLGSEVQGSLAKANTAYQKPSTGIPESDLSADVQQKLNSGGGGGGESYTLPPATKTTLGGVIVGDNLLVDGTGKISVDVATDAEADNTRPISSAAVYAEIGNINILLSQI